MIHQDYQLRCLCMPGVAAETSCQVLDSAFGCLFEKGSWGHSEEKLLNPNILLDNTYFWYLIEGFPGFAGL